MKIRFGAILLTLAMLLTGCSGFWTLPPSSTSTNPTTPTTLSSGVFYVLNQATKQIAVYSIASGTLSPVSGSPYSLSAAPSCIAIAPGGGYLYVGTLSGIYVYSIGTGGGLTILNGGGVISSDIPSAMQMGPNGSWLIDAFINGGGQVEMNAIPINPGGTYTAGLTVPSVAFPITKPSLNQMVLSPDGANLFVALGTAGTIVVPFNSGNANPLGSQATGISVANTGGSALSVAVDPTNRLFYIGETLANSAADSGGLRVFTYSSLGSATPRFAPTQISGSPIASGGLSPSAILPEASGETVYVANGQGPTGSGNISWFPITLSGTTYSIAAGSTIVSGIFPVGVAEDSLDHFVLAVSTGGSTTSGDPDLEAYTMSSGALTAAIESNTGTDPVGAIAVAALP